MMISLINTNQPTPPLPQEGGAGHGILKSLAKIVPCALSESSAALLDARAEKLIATLQNPLSSSADKQKAKQAFERSLVKRAHLLNPQGSHQIASLTRAYFNKFYQIHPLTLREDVASELGLWPYSSQAPRWIPSGTTLLKAAVAAGLIYAAYTAYTKWPEGTFEKWYKAYTNWQDGNTDVTDCTNVKCSTNAIGCSEVTHCKDIYHSSHASHSQQVNNSEDISFCKNIDSCQKTKFCNNLSDCTDAERCHDSSSSNKISHSHHLKDCTDIEYGENLANCHRAKYAKNSQNGERLTHVDYVKNTYDASYASHVEGSCQVYGSPSQSCQNIFYSTNVSESTNIAHCKNIIRCHNVCYEDNVQDVDYGPFHWKVMCTFWDLWYSVFNR